MMQSEFDIARQNFGSNEKLNQQGKKTGFFSKLFNKRTRKSSTGDAGDADQVSIQRLIFQISCTGLRNSAKKLVFRHTSTC